MLYFFASTQPQIVLPFRSKNVRRGGDLNSRSPNGEPALKAHRIRVERKDMERYLAIREVEGLSRTWLYDIRYFLTSYLCLLYTSPSPRD